MGKGVNDKPPEEASGGEVVLREIKKIWQRHQEEKAVTEFMTPPAAYSDKRHAKQNHAYYTSLLMDRIKWNKLFSANNEVTQKALDVVKQLTTEPLKDMKVSETITVSQLLFLLDHAINHQSVADKEQAASAFYTALSKY